MKNSLKAVMAGLAVLALPGTAQAAQPGVWGEFRNAGLGACVDVAPGNATVVTGCDGSNSQRWLLENLGEVTGEWADFRVRKNDRECAELAGTWTGATLRLSPCDLGVPGQRFQVTQSGWELGPVQLHGKEHRQLLKAYHRGEAPFVSATLEFPGDNAVWTFR